MRILKIYPTSVNSLFIEEAVRHLQDGGLIIYPTDTLYAIGCNALSNSAIEKVCQIKNIDPRKESLSVVCADISMASEYARIDNRAYQLLRENVPGPFTFILPAATTLPKVFKGRKEVGIRIPDNPIAIELARALGNPLLSTSITFDEDEPESGSHPEEIALRYGSERRINLMINGGRGGVQGSCIVNLTESSSPEIIREGPVELKY